MDYVRLASILAHTISGVTGILANSVLIFLILKRTPSRLATYSVLLFNFALWDLLTCAAAVFVQQRIMPEGLGLYYSSHGPCKFFGPQACYVGYSFMLHGFSHMLWSLLFSFCYRYYVLEHEPPAKRTILIMLVFVYTPSFFQFVSFSFASDDSDKVRRAIEKGLGYNMSGECVSGHLNIMKWKTLFTILHMTVPVTPVYIAILLLGKAIISKLRIETMSQQTRQLHSQLLKTLACQACLPILFLFGVITYTLGQFNIWHHEVLESTTFVLFGFITMLNPMVSLYFITPYREWIRANICCSAAPSHLIKRHWTSQLSHEESRSRVNPRRVYTIQVTQ